MYRMVFIYKWVNKILACLTSVYFAFKIKAKVSGSVIPSRRLRQGVSISPYLFLLVVDAFSTLISKASGENKINGAKICNGTRRMSHLFFVDNSLLFAKATIRKCFLIADIISSNEKASGHRVNLDKTNVIFSKCMDVNRR